MAKLGLNYNCIPISTHAPTEEKDVVAKENCYSSLEKVCDAVPNYDLKTVIRDFNAKVGKEFYLHLACGGQRLHNEKNDNEKRMVNFALGRDLAETGTWCQHKDIHMVTWKSPDNKICNQIDYTQVDRGQCTHVFDLRSMGGAEVESDHFFSESQN